MTSAEMRRVLTVRATVMDRKPVAPADLDWMLDNVAASNPDAAIADRRFEFLVSLEEACASPGLSAHYKARIADTAIVYLNGDANADVIVAGGIMVNLRDKRAVPLLKPYVKSREWLVSSMAKRDLRLLGASTASP